MLQTRLILAAALLIVTTGLAQASKPDPMRSKALGEVRNAEGKPWQGARVFLASRPMPNDSQFGEVDLVEATTDERGRFRAAILRGRSYRAWARSDVEQGKYRLTGTVRGVVAGMPALLQESKERTLVERWRIAGLDAWKHRGPFKYRVTEGSEHSLSFDIVLDGANSFAIPPTARPATYFEVWARRDGIDCLLLRKRLSRKKPDADEKDPATGKGAKEGEYELKVAGPKKYGFAVWDAAKGKPVAGAMIYKSWYTLEPLGKTDADGFASIELPSDMSTGSFFAAADGYVVGGMQKGASVDFGANDEKRKARRDMTDYHTQLQRGASTYLTVMIRPGEPAAGLPVLLQGMSIHKRKNGSSGSSFAMPMRTNDKGMLVMPTTQVWSQSGSLQLVLSRAHLMKLPSSWRPGLQPLLQIHLASIEKAKSSAKKPAEFVISELVPIELQILNASGAPADRPRVRVGPIGEQQSYARDPGLAADRTGRFRLLVPANTRLGVAIVGDGGHRLAAFKALRGKDSVRVVPVRIRLEKGVSISGQVVNADGKAVEGARIYGSLRNQSGMVLEDVSVADRAAGKRGGRKTAVASDKENRVEFVTKLSRNATSVLQSLMSSASRSTKTDANGRFTLVVTNKEATYQLNVSKKVDGIWRRCRLQVEVDGESVKNVELELN